MKMNKETKKYLMQVRNLLPTVSAQEERFIADIRNRIEILSIENTITYEFLCEEFGKPNELVYNYVESLDLDDVMKKIAF